MALCIEQAASHFSHANQAMAPLPYGYVPEGVPETAIDSITLSFLDQIVPDGRAVFTHLLYYATLDPHTTIQGSLFHRTGERKNEAIVLIKNVNVLAQTPTSPFRAPDAYARRLIALEALDVIRRKNHRTYTEIHIPLGKRAIHVPSLLQALWHMHASYKDPKVKQLARKMMKKVQSREFLTWISSTCEQQLTQELTPIVHLLDAFFCARGMKENITVLMKASTIIAQLLLPEKYGRFEHDGDLFLSTLSPTRPIPVTDMDKLMMSSDELDCIQSEKNSDSELLCFVPPDELSERNTPMCLEISDKAFCSVLEKDEVQRLSLTNSPFLSENHLFLPNLGESITPVSLSDHSLSSQKYTQDTESLNDSSDEHERKSGEKEADAYRDIRSIEEIRHDARMYADVLDGVGNYRWMGKLVACVQQYPETIRHLALIDTLFHSSFPDWRGKPRSPGAWFCKAAESFAHGAQVPPEVRRWAESGLPYHEIDKALQHGRRVPRNVLVTDTPDDTPFEKDGGEKKELSTLSLLSQSEADQVYTQHMRICPSLKSRMKRQQADTLCRRIRQQGKGYGICAEVCPGDQDNYVVVTQWDGIEEVHGNEFEWDHYFSEVKTCLC